MKTNQQMSAIPAPKNGVSVQIEGTMTRVYFDFKECKREDCDPDIMDCESVDLTGRTYADIVSAIINDRYDSDSVQAITANYMAAINNNDITEDKRNEYLQEYADFQSWRVHAKEIARIATNIIAEY